MTGPFTSLNRSALQNLSQERILDAEQLVRTERYSGAYYIAGYAIECALKASIAKQTREYDFPDRKRALDSYTHDFTQLIGLAGLRPELDEERIANEDFAVNWAVVAQWRETSRYELRNQLEAEDLYKAITDQENGVLQWLQKRW